MSYFTNKSVLDSIREACENLKTLVSCKHHLTEAMRVQIAGSVGLSVSGSTVNDVTPTTSYLTPAYAKFMQQLAQGNLMAEIGNIQNVTA